ncbi:acid phosphatase 1-like [Rhododendron vialii]|uniref:acid phosphatase 1-like n=1 Tax=Rhododendron vialii TaxID=182163 RepID=UPI00265EADF9|nr:acid phosphatase 1-like [Rhododendron vialii]
MEAALCFLLATTLATTSQAYQSHLLPHSGGGAATSAAHRLHHNKISCSSWRLAVETNNTVGWDIVPGECAEYVANYMLGPQYPEDCFAVISTALAYAKNLTLAGDGKDIWVFDLDETALSELDYYSLPDVAFGAKEYNSTKKKEYQKKGTTPALPAVLELYKELVPLGFKIVFLSASSESNRESRVSNLKRVGYHTWEKLILKQTSEHGTSSLMYKSKKRTELVEAGYRIMGNMGDQWSDISSSNPGNRTFKLPNPMYYVN